MSDDLERAVGRLEGKIDQGFNNLCQRIDRLNDGVFGRDGIERRLRDCESEVRQIKTQAGMIAFFVSALAAIAMWIREFFR